MRTGALLLAALPLAARAVNVVIANDDGWAEINIREFYYSLTKAGFNSIISAPALNQSGTGSTSAPPTVVLTGCEFDSCPPGSPAIGHNASMLRFNYVNAFPVDAMMTGIQTLSKKLLGGKADIAVAGPNVGNNAGLTTLLSGTVGAATEASKLGVPGLAFSGDTGDQTAWNVQPVPAYSQVYGELSTFVTKALVKSGKPYLPDNIWLNVNFPATNATSCSSPSKFKYVLSRINTALPFTPADVVTCKNGGHLPTETDVIGTPGCYSSISVGVATTKMDADAAQQKVVLNKLHGILSCLPASS